MFYDVIFPQMTAGYAVSTIAELFREKASLCSSLASANSIFSAEVLSKGQIWINALNLSHERNNVEHPCTYIFYLQYKHLLNDTFDFFSFKFCVCGIH